MASRDMERIVQQTKVNDRYCLMSDEAERLIEYITVWGRHPYDVIDSAFKYGYAMGQRALKAEQKKNSEDGRHGIIEH